MKRIVVCCDGTWNRPDRVIEGRVRPSNVAKLALAAQAQDSRGTPQRVYVPPNLPPRSSPAPP